MFTDVICAGLLAAPLIAGAILVAGVLLVLWLRPPPRRRRVKHPQRHTLPTNDTDPHLYGKAKR